MGQGAIGVAVASSAQPARTPALLPSVQAVPPALAAATVSRPRLERRLDSSTAGRLTVIVADAGAGKSTLLAGWAVRKGAAWYTVTESDADLIQLASGLLGALALRVPALPGAVSGRLERALGPEATGDERSPARACAALIADALASHLTRDLVLVLDDLQELGSGNAGAWLVEALCRQGPARLHIVISSRDPLPFSVERLRGQGQATFLSGAQFAFDASEIEAILEAGLGTSDPEVVGELEAVTNGWPAAVRLALEALADVAPADRPATVRRFLQSSGAIYAYLAEEVLGRASPGVRELLDAVAPLPRFSAALCVALGVAGAAATVRSLEARGLFVQPQGEGDWFTLHPLIREHLRGRAAADAGATSRAAEAAPWFEEQGLHRDAIACLQAAGDQPAIARLLDEHGAALLTGGDVETVITAASNLPPGLRTPAIERVEGEARQIHGDWEGALRCFRSLAPGDAVVEPGIAWRMGLIHHLRGELDEALQTYGRGRLDGEGQRADIALLRSWTAAAHWLRGDVEVTRSQASAALEDATASGDDHALAAAHTIAAMVAALDGDRRANDAHYLRALDHAARSGDVLQAIRIRANRGSRLHEEGYYAEALDELGAAIAMAELAGFASFHALALSNRGQALARLGRLDDAIADLEASRQLYQRLESRFISYPLGHLGDVHAERGAFAVARGYYEEAIAVAEGAGDVQGIRPSLSGLAELLARDEPEQAAAFAERAVGFGPGIGLVRSLNALGRVELARGRMERARSAASRAAAEARGRRDRAGLAESLEVEAAAIAEDAAAADRLREALVIWRDLHSDIPAARVELRLAERNQGEPAVDAEAVLHAAGAVRERAPLAASDHARAGDASGIRVRTLGGFEVARDGIVVSTAEWGSKKARDLFKILLTRRGLHVPREQIVELLWPGEDPDRSARRLSVALSTARSVLDPQRRFPANQFVAADREAAWIERDRLTIDLDGFLADAAEGLARAAAGRADAGAPLVAAETAHRGEFLVEDAFEDWAAGMREECRQAYISVGHALARLSGDAGDHEAAARYLRRVLQNDEFDENAHLALVTALASAGHPADARRAYGAYLARMEELGVEAAPFPA